MREAVGVLEAKAPKAAALLEEGFEDIAATAAGMRAIGTLLMEMHEGRQEGRPCLDMRERLGSGGADAEVGRLATRVPKDKDKEAA
jgi:hypothetical protein